MSPDKRNENVPVIHRDAMLRLLDRRKFSSFQTMYKELMNRPPHEQILGNVTENLNANDPSGTANETNPSGTANDPVPSGAGQNPNANDTVPNSDETGSNQNDQSQDSGRTSEIQSSSSNRDESSVPNTKDSGRHTENDEGFNQSFEEIGNSSSQPQTRFRHSRRSDQTSFGNYDTPSREANLLNSLAEGQPIDANLSENIGIFSFIFNITF